MLMIWLFFFYRWAIILWPHAIHHTPHHTLISAPLIQKALLRRVPGTKQGKRTLVLGSDIGPLCNH